MVVVQNILLAALLAIGVHELAHVLMLKILRIPFRFYFNGIRPEFEILRPITENEAKLTGISGFSAEFFMALVLVLLLGTKGAWVDKTFLACYVGFCAAHLTAYPFYALVGASDFNLLDSDDDS